MANTKLKTEIVEKLPPQNIQAEISLLGSLLLDKEAVVKIADKISADDFYSHKHRIIFESIIELYDKREPIDLVTLSNRLEEKKELDNVGGSSYLTELTSSVPSAAHASHYADIVRQKATLRRLITAANKIDRLAYELSDKDSESMETTLDQAEQILFEVSQRHLKQNFISIKDVLAESFDRLDNLHRDKKKIRGIPTGFKDLDNLLAGLQKSDLIVLAARPSMGKTSLALNIAQHVATREGVPVGLFSLEMSKEQLIDRLLAAEAKIDSWKLRTGNLEDRDFEKINKAMGVLAEAPIYIDDSAITNVMEMRTKARRLQMEHNLGLIVVDYLQLMSGKSGSSDNRVQEISEISRSLKGLARELDIPVIAISQLSRNVESRHPQIPQLADLRESGSIEQDADLVIFIYREDYYNKESERKNVADVLIKKHRNGPVGDTELFFIPEQMVFRSIDKQHNK
ncbi:MAG: replicative DNA helicase [bacterium]|nr:replicative DNA helicase [bacterium]